MDSDLTATELLDLASEKLDEAIEACQECQEQCRLAKLGIYKLKEWIKSG